MAEAFSKLFEPIKIGKVEIKNRIAMAPMCVMGLVTQDGCFSQRAIDYYVERAKGGTGLIIAADAHVENEIEEFKMPIFPCITPSNSFHFIATASELTEQVHAYGAKAFLQMTAGFGHNAVPAMLVGEPVSPSATPNYWDPTVTCRELTTEEVKKLVSRFGEAAEIAVAAGFDGIEVHAMHEGYLLDSFTIAMFNRRRDKYGGDLRGRLTFPIEIVHEIKNKVGRDFPVQLRLSVKSYIKDWNQGGLPSEEFKEKGRDTEESLEAAKILEEAGYDAFNADAGTYEAWYWAHPPRYQEYGCYLPLTEKLKRVVRVPVLVAGKMNLPELAEETIEEGKAADMIALGRGLLADPYWPNKVMQGRIKSIRPCLGCYDGCLGREMLGRPISCAVNPACGREKEYAVQRADKAKSVMVIGGGVAGMEAARVAALRGHQVALYEKSEKLGGHVIEASVPAFKKGERQLLDWYEAELNELRVEISLNKEVSPALVQEKKPDCVIIATGSKPIILDVPGINKDKVTTATGLLLGRKKPGESVIIVGGGLVGCETALWLAQQGKKVTIVEMLSELMVAGLPVPHSNRMMLLDLLKFHKVGMSTNTKFLGVSGDDIVVENKSHRRMLSADTVVMAIGLEPEQELYRSIAGRVPNLYLIGDARRPQNIMYAIWDAYEVARNV